MAGRGGHWEGQLLCLCLGLDGTLTLRVPRRRRQWRWWLAAGGDPVSLAERFSCLADPDPANPDPANSDPANSDPADPGAAVIQGCCGSLGDRLLACLDSASPLDPTVSGADPGRAGGIDVRLHTDLTLWRWHRGPLWIAVWRRHGDLGWQRRCGPMPLNDFLVHQRHRPGPGSPELLLPVRQLPRDGS